MEKRGILVILILIAIALPSVSGKTCYSPGDYTCVEQEGIPVCTYTDTTQICTYLGCPSIGCDTCIMDNRYTSKTCTDCPDCQKCDGQASSTLKCKACATKEICTSDTKECCLPKTCSGLGFECGTFDDGCGGTITCGTCTRAGTACLEGICGEVLCRDNKDNDVDYLKDCLDPDCINDCRCIDPDGTDNFVEEGTVTDRDGVLWKESCADGKHLTEYNCKEGNLDTTAKTCGDHCFFDEVAEAYKGQCCTTLTCGFINKNCGLWPDGCGLQMDCGSCTAPKVCTNGVCVDPETCDPDGTACYGTKIDKNCCGGYCNNKKCAQCINDDGCDAVGLKKCAGTSTKPTDTYYLCEMGADGCLHWSSVPAACEEGSCVCKAGQCITCTQASEQCINYACVSSEVPYFQYYDPKDTVSACYIDYDVVIGSYQVESTPPTQCCTTVDGFVQVEYCTMPSCSEPIDTGYCDYCPNGFCATGEICPEDSVACNEACKIGGSCTDGCVYDSMVPPGQNDAKCSGPCTVGQNFCDGAGNCKCLPCDLDNICDTGENCLCSDCSCTAPKSCDPSGDCVTPENCDKIGDENGNGECDFYPKACTKGDPACQIQVLSASTGEYTCGPAIDVYCETSPGGANSIFPYVDTNENTVYDEGTDIDCTYPISIDWIDSDIVEFAGCNFVGAHGLLNVMCSVDTSKSYQSGDDQGAPVVFKQCICESYTTDEACVAGACEVCPECSGNKFGGVVRCVTPSGCPSYCSFSKCGNNICDLAWGECGSGQTCNPTDCSCVVGPAEDCDTPGDEDLNGKCDYDSCVLGEAVCCSHGDELCSVEVVDVGVSNVAPLANSVIDVTCTASVPNVNSIFAYIDEDMDGTYSVGDTNCGWNSGSGWLDEENVTFIGCNVGGSGTKNVGCGVYDGFGIEEYDRSYQSDVDVSIQIVVAPTACSERSEAACIVDCEWVDDCKTTSPKYSGGLDRCVAVSVPVTYSCSVSACVETCDGSGGCTLPDVCNPASCTCGCTPNCFGKVCGDNGCGGTCGICSVGFECSADGQCVGILEDCDSPGDEDLNGECDYDLGRCGEDSHGDINCPVDITKIILGSDDPVDYLPVEGSVLDITCTASQTDLNSIYPYLDLNNNGQYDSGIDSVSASCMDDAEWDGLEVIFPGCDFGLTPGTKKVRCSVDTSKSYKAWSGEDPGIEIDVQNSPCSDHNNEASCTLDPECRYCPECNSPFSGGLTRCIEKTLNCPSTCSKECDADCESRNDCGTYDNRYCDSTSCTCSCDPESCDSLGAQCGAVDDGCGGQIECPSCPVGQNCVNNLCKYPNNEDGKCDDGIDNDNDLECDYDGHYNGHVCGTDWGDESCLVSIEGIGVPTEPVIEGTGFEVTCTANWHDLYSIGLIFEGDEEIVCPDTGWSGNTVTFACPPTTPPGEYTATCFVEPTRSYPVEDKELMEATVTVLPSYCDPGSECNPDILDSLACEVEGVDGTQVCEADCKYGDCTVQTICSSGDCCDMTTHRTKLPDTPCATPELSCPDSCTKKTFVRECNGVDNTCPETGSTTQEYCGLGGSCRDGECLSTACDTTECPTNSCDKEIETGYETTCDNTCSVSGECDPCDCTATETDCSLADNTDGDTIQCNCNCDNYDVTEAGALCEDGKDNDCNDECDYDSSSCDQGDSECAVGVTGISADPETVTEGDEFIVSCTATVGGINSIGATIDGVECPDTGEWNENVMEFICTTELEDGSYLSLGPHTARCFVDEVKSYAITWQEERTMTVTVEACPADHCDDMEDCDEEGVDCGGSCSNECCVAPKIDCDGVCLDSCPLECNGENGCEAWEDCSCPDCYGQRGTCKEGNICDAENEECSCPTGKTKCSDGTCKESCTSECNTDYTCQDNEGCSCYDCWYEKDSCVSGDICIDTCTKCDLEDGICTDDEDCKCPDCDGAARCNSCDGDKNCEDGENCLCSDCFGEESVCIPGNVCDGATKKCKCMPGTTLCYDGGCRPGCDSECNHNGKCEVDNYEGCSCEDCLNRQSSCTTGAVCGEDGNCGCPKDTTLCDDGTCKASCTSECNAGGACDPGEGCGCRPACDGKKDGCVFGTFCQDGLCEESECSDTDGGDEPIDKGTIRVGSVEKTDFCNPDGTLTEYYCDGNKMLDRIVDCAVEMEDPLFGCIEGACIVKECSEGPCCTEGIPEPLGTPCYYDQPLNCSADKTHICEYKECDEFAKCTVFMGCLGCAFQDKIGNCGAPTGNCQVMPGDDICTYTNDASLCSDCNQKCNPATMMCEEMIPKGGCELTWDECMASDVIDESQCACHNYWTGCVP